MSQIFIFIPGIGNKCVSFKETDRVGTLLERTEETPESDCYIIHQGKLITRDALLQNGHTYHIVPRLVGGKGGFGSMLRALGAQIEKTTNREACRDLSGRRMRDVNNEQKLREWVAKAAEREREREQRRKERWEKRRAEPRHNFNDPDYVEQKMKVTESLEEALQQGLQKASSSTVSAAVAPTRKRKSDEPGPSSTIKKRFEWLGDGISSSDLDSESDCDNEKDLASSTVDDGAVSTPVNDTHSDSGVESTTETKIKESPMDVDSDSSGKDSAVNIEPISDGSLQATDMLTDNSTEGTSRLPATDNKCDDLEPFDPNTVDLLSYNSIEELENLGLDALKAVLMARGLKCGGTLHQRAERLWSVRGIPHEQIDRSLLAKPTKGKKK